MLGMVSPAEATLAALMEIYRQQEPFVGSEAVASGDVPKSALRTR